MRKFASLALVAALGVGAATLSKPADAGVVVGVGVAPPVVGYAPYGVGYYPGAYWRYARFGHPGYGYWRGYGWGHGYYRGGYRGHWR